MSARGPHDSFDTALVVVEQALAAVNRGDPDAAIRYSDPGIEHVTRDGVVHGTDRLYAELSAQLERWQIGYELEELPDAGDGALIALVKVERRSRESGEVEWRAWPAFVLRVRDGKIAFFEGYVNRDKALAELRRAG